MKRPSLWLGAAAVILLTLAAHVRGLGGQFVQWDDNTHITQNVAIRTLSFDSLRLMFTTSIAHLYCPLTWLSFAVDYQMWGRDPFGYHLTNLLLHLANTVLVLVLVHRLIENIPAAILTAAIFGVHPLRVESVAWATERKDVLFCFFYLLGLLAYIRWVHARDRRYYWGCLVLFAASALSKSAAVTFPVVLLLLDAFEFHRREPVEKPPFFVVSFLVGIATLVAQSGGAGATIAPASMIPLWARIGLVCYCSLFYVGKLFWPFHLTAIYPAFEDMNWRLVHALGWLLAAAAVTGAIWTLRRRAPLLWPSWLFYLIALSPTIGLLPVGAHIVADRYAYLALLGIALPVSVGLVAALRRAWPAAGIVLIGLAMLGDRRTRVWFDTDTLFQSVLAENPQTYTALVNLTSWFTGLNRLDEAIAAGKRSVELRPAGLIGRTNLARAYIKAQRYREAIAVLRPTVEHGVEDHAVWEELHECFVALGDNENAQVAAGRMALYPMER